MIVRILSDNQYDFPDELADQLDKMDDPLTDALQTNDEQLFNTTLAQVIAFVREKGTLVPEDEVVPSAVIVPAPDTTLAEARQYLEQSEEESQPATPGGAGEA